MDAYLLDWANLLLRWAHVIVAIAWIGSSFYFVFLDNSLTPPEDEELKRKGVDGELWAVHGGGFYHPVKFNVAPPKLPDHLHWFAVEADRALHERRVGAVAPCPEPVADDGHSRCFRLVLIDAVRPAARQSRAQRCKVAVRRHHPVDDFGRPPFGQVETLVLEERHVFEDLVVPAVEEEEIR